MSFIPSYKKPDGGGGYVPCSWSDGTDEEIVTALEKHYAGEVDLTEYWSVGDMRSVTLSYMSATGVGEYHVQQTVIFVLSHIGGKTLSDGVTTCAFQVDQVHCLNEKGYMNSNGNNTGGWKSSNRRTWCNSTYKNAIPSALLPIFKEFINPTVNNTSGVENITDTFALRSEKEIFGSTTNSYNGEGSQVTWYATSANRIKQVNGTVSYWWERSFHKNSPYNFCAVSTTGIANSNAANNSWGIAPFGVI